MVRTASSTRPPATAPVNAAGEPTQPREPGHDQPVRPKAARRSTSGARPPARAGDVSWPRSRPAIVTWTARLVALTGIVTVTSALFPASARRIEVLTEIVPRVGALTATAAAATVGVLLMALATGLRRGKRAAWVTTVVLSAVAVVLHLVKGLDVEEAALAAAVLAVLLANRRHFTARPDPHGALWAVFVGASTAVAGVVAGTVFLSLREHRLVGHPGLGELIVQAAMGVVGLDGPVRFSYPHTHTRAAVLTGMFGIVAVLTTMGLLLRPGRRPTVATADDCARLQRLLVTTGDRDSLGYFALRRDRAVIFSGSGKAAVSYQVLGGVSLAAGDPIGDPEAWPGAIEAWLAQAHAHGWVPAVLGCSETAGHVLARYGLSAMELGDEAIVHTREFTLEGRPMRGVRQAVGRMRRAGYTATVLRAGDLDDAQRAEAIAAADAFRDGTVERGFSMALGRLGDPADDDCVLVVARDADGRIRGLLHFVPWGEAGLSLDLMRGDRTAENGLVEYLTVTAIEWAAQRGVERISLNFAVFRSVFARGERLGAGPVLRAWRRILLLASRFWQIESLYRANAKYQPTWQPRFLCYPTVADLPRISIAALRAEAFLVMPRLAGVSRARRPLPYRAAGQEAGR